jgi:hypothetical protein
MLRKQQTSFKRITAIIFLLLFTYNAVISHVSLWVWKIYMMEQIEEMARNLANQSLEEISLPYSGNTEHEISFNDRIFDVIRYQIEGATVHYLCVEDFTENILTTTHNKEISDKSITAKNKWDGHAKQLQKNNNLKYLTEKFVQLLPPTPHVYRYGFEYLITITMSIAVCSPPPDSWLI